MVKFIVNTTVEELLAKYPMFIKQSKTSNVADCSCISVLEDANYCFKCGKKYITTTTDITSLNRDSIYDWSRYDLNNILKDDKCIAPEYQIIHKDIHDGYVLIKNNYMIKPEYIIYKSSDKNDVIYTGSVEISDDLCNSDISTLNKKYNTFKEYFGDLGDITIK